MDVYRYIQELYEEKKRLDRAIETLEALVEGKEPPSNHSGRRGRRPGMTEEERRKISERMQRYWAQRRSKSGSSGTPPSA
jgi:hypothetical protein